MIISFCESEVESSEKEDFTGESTGASFCKGAAKEDSLSLFWVEASSFYEALSDLSVLSPAGWFGSNDVS